MQKIGRIVAQNNVGAEPRVISIPIGLSAGNSHMLIHQELKRPRVSHTIHPIYITIQLYKVAGHARTCRSTGDTRPQLTGVVQTAALLECSRCLDERASVKVTLWSTSATRLNHHD